MLREFIIKKVNKQISDKMIKTKQTRKGGKGMTDKCKEEIR